MVIGSGLLWWRSNRLDCGTARVAGSSTVPFAFGSLVALLLGLATWAVGMIKGW